MTVQNNVYTKIYSELMKRIFINDPTLFIRSVRYKYFIILIPGDTFRIKEDIALFICIVAVGIFFLLGL